MNNYLWDEAYNFAGGIIFSSNYFKRMRQYLGVEIAEYSSQFVGESMFQITFYFIKPFTRYTKKCNMCLNSCNYKLTNCAVFHAVVQRILILGLCNYVIMCVTLNNHA